MDRFIGNFLVRQGTSDEDGNNASQLFYPVRISDAFHPDGILSKFLKKQAEELRVELAQLNAEAADRVIREIVHGQMEPLIYERIMQLGLHDACDAVKTENDTLLQAVARFARRRILEYQRMEVQFEELLRVLKPFEREIVWLKGTVLSRTLYEKPFHRSSTDFDIVVRPRVCTEVFSCLRQAGYSIDYWDNLEGKSKSLSSIGLIGSGPAPETEFTHEIQAGKPGCALIELKFDPLKSGLQMKEIDRFYSEANCVSWADSFFFSPGIVDHLMLELFNMHRRGFKSWPWLYDIHLLCGLMTNEDWPEFVRRCRHEGVGLSAWAGLELARDRLATVVPDEVMGALAPKAAGPLRRRLTFVVGSRFVWNEKGIGELVLNMMLLGDQRRKAGVLLRMLCPSKQFLTSYYLQTKDARVDHLLLCVLVHALVVFFPRLRLTAKLGKFIREVGCQG